MVSTSETRFLIPGAVGALELSVTYPPQTAPFAVICHPHPLFGGTLDNKVVYTLAKTFKALGAGTVRFNFRGVGQSEGHFAQGEGELEDLKTVVTWLRATQLPTAVWLVGYSFGGFVALRGHQAVGADRLLLVAPALNRLTEGIKVAIPTGVIQGQQDEIVSATMVKQWAVQQGCSFYELMQADHFFHRQLQELRDTIAKLNFADPL